MSAEKINMKMLWEKKTKICAIYYKEFVLILNEFEKNILVISICEKLLKISITNKILFLLYFIINIEVCW